MQPVEHLETPSNLTRASGTVEMAQDPAAFDYDSLLDDVLLDTKRPADPPADESHQGACCLDPVARHYVIHAVRCDVDQSPPASSLPPSPARASAPCRAYSHRLPAGEVYQEFLPADRMFEAYLEGLADSIPVGESAMPGIAPAPCTAWRGRAASCACRSSMSRLGDHVVTEGHNGTLFFQPVFARIVAS